MPPSPAAAASFGALALASGMGIGRFAFTPLMPLMQQAQHLSVRDGAWLAAANYGGYLFGALACFALDPRPGPGARRALVAVALLTAAMGLTDFFAAWWLLRALAGVASAFVLVCASSWAMSLLAAQRRQSLSGAVFAGVGTGIVFAGLVGLASGVTGASPASTWIGLGVAAAAVAALAWRPMAHGAATMNGSASVAPLSLDADGWLLVVCYGLFGYGYIIPATFLPALGRQIFPEPLVFGWAWPVFGAAAAASTLLSSRWLAAWHPRRLFAAGMALMALGVLAPALHAGLAALLLSALAVGGTFMVVTMAGLQEARRIAGDAAPKAIAAMTAAFALGQLIGPLTLPSGTLTASLLVPSVAAAALLFASALLLWRSVPRAAAISIP